MTTTGAEVAAEAVQVSVRELLKMSENRTSSGALVVEVA